MTKDRVGFFVKSVDVDTGTVTICNHLAGGEETAATKIVLRNAEDAELFYMPLCGEDITHAEG